MKNQVSYSNEDGIRDLLIGRSIVQAGGESLTLDDGTVLTIVPNDGCHGCPSGNYWIEELNQSPINAIMAVEFEAEDSNEDAYCEVDTTYRIFVLAENTRIKLLEVQGSDGNGYYGSGYWIEVKSS